MNYLMKIKKNRMKIKNEIERIKGLNKIWKKY